MKHLQKALESVEGHQEEYVKLEDNVISFKIQDGPIGEAGINGIQATDMLVFLKNLFSSLNDNFPCRENALTITKIEEGIHWQYARTLDRRMRNVEGTNQA